MHAGAAYNKQGVYMLQYQSKSKMSKPPKMRHTHEARKVTLHACDGCDTACKLDEAPTGCAALKCSRRLTWEGAGRRKSDKGKGRHKRGNGIRIGGHHIHTQGRVGRKHIGVGVATWAGRGKQGNMSHKSIGGTAEELATVASSECNLDSIPDF